MITDKAIVAFIGLAGWYEEGIHMSGTFNRTGIIDEEDLTASIRVDLRPVIHKSCNPVADIMKRPNLDLSLPKDNVRALFEGCIGNKGSIQGHPWDGKEEITGTYAVGLNVYLGILRDQGAIITGWN